MPDNNMLVTKFKVPPLVRAMRQLALPDKFDPPTSIQSLITEAGLGKEVYTYLKNSHSEEARSIVKLYFALEPIQRKHVTIDHLIAAAKVDHIKVWGALSEEVLRVKGEAATMIAAVESPDAMRSAAWYAGLEGGHADRKMVLQTARVAPVPTNQISRINIIGNRIDNKITSNTVIPRLEDVVRDMDVIQKTIPALIEGHVPRNQD
jgi:hypothetical protein